MQPGNDVSLMEKARRNRRLGDEHRAFLLELEEDAEGYPRLGGHYAGVGGVYAVRKTK